MAFSTINIESRYLNGNTEVSIILPDRPMPVDARDFYVPERKYPVLWLLHGGKGDDSDWIRKSAIEVYASELNMIVVMPDAGNSAYTKWTAFTKDFDMHRFIVDELMPMIYGWFPASTRREDNYIAGLSMGGWGAGKLAVRHPERFAGAAILSSTVRNYDFMFAEKPPQTHRQYQNIVDNYGGMEGFHAGEDYTTLAELIRMAKQEPERLPALYTAYGDLDVHREEFEDFVRICRESNVPIRAEVYHGMLHEWRMWDLGIQEALRFFGFPLKRDPRSEIL